MIPMTLKAYIITFWLGDEEEENHSVVIAPNEKEAKRLVAQKMHDDANWTEKELDIPSWQVEERPINTAVVLDVWHQY